MDRRQIIKSMALGAASVPLLRAPLATAAPQAAGDALASADAHKLQSPWHHMQDMQWAGPAYWANRLQDWRIRNGALGCLNRGENRTVSCLTHQLENWRRRFYTTAHGACSCPPTRPLIVSPTSRSARGTRGVTINKASSGSLRRPLVIIEVFIAERRSCYPLFDKRFNRLFDSIRIPVIRMTLAQTLQNSRASLDFLQ